MSAAIFEMMSGVLLYHYTAMKHLPKILSDGVLKVTESNVSRKRAHAGPDVVWLLTKDDPTGAGHGLDGSALDKRAVRFTVDVDKRAVHKWRAWAQSKGMDPAWMSIMARFGGSGSWRVVERPIPRSEWTAVHVLGEAGIYVEYLGVDQPHSAAQRHNPARPT